MNYADILFAKKLAGGGGSAPAPTLIEKEITENGTYSAFDDGADGYSEVSVSVASDIAKMTYITDVVSGSAAHIYNDGEGRTIIAATIIPRTNIITVSFSYPEDFTPQCTVFEGNMGMALWVSPDGASYVPIVGGGTASINIDTTQRKITITLSGLSFSAGGNTHLQCWAIR